MNAYKTRSHSSQTLLFSLPKTRLYRPSKIRKRVPLALINTPCMLAKHAINARQARSFSAQNAPLASTKRVVSVHKTRLQYSQTILLTYTKRALNAYKTRSHRSQTRLSSLPKTRLHWSSNTAGSHTKHKLRQISNRGSECRRSLKRNESCNTEKKK